ncbi:MAG: hypothetical protein ACREFX_12650 [Opitutaceae bacterium]
MGRFGSIVSRFGAAAAAALFMVLSGCASSDLSKSAKTVGEVVECLPTDTPAPTVVARAIWFPDASGFGTTGASPTGQWVGVLALAGGKLWFMSWDDAGSHYDVQRRIDLQTAAKVFVDRAGPAALLVVESRNLAFDSFELMRAGQFSSDLAGTRDLFQKIRVFRSQHPDED